jgi:hypothetical protein
VLDEFELDLDKGELATLLAAYDKEKDGVVRYMPFCDALEEADGGADKKDQATDVMGYLMELLKRAGEKVRGPADERPVEGRGRGVPRRLGSFHV